MVEQVEKTTMQPATLAALRASIKHWQENVNAERPEDVKLGPENCALCNLFNKDGDSDVCNYCPVKDKTGYNLCIKTPYSKASITSWNWERGGVTRTTYQAAAQAELDFLISLLPEGESP